MSVAHAEVSVSSTEARRFHLEIDSDFMRLSLEDQRALASRALFCAAWRDNNQRMAEQQVVAIDGQIGMSGPREHVVPRDAYIDISDVA